ncbi:MAG: NAD(P)H-hydrate dehydratase [Bacteroidota bacterium]
MKILTAQQIYQADKATIENKKISSVDLMEYAAGECVNWIRDYLVDYQNNIHIFCGIGNNGGDGLVIARKLLNAGFDVNIYIVNFSKNRSEDFKINYKRLIELDHQPIDLRGDNEFPEISENEIIIDAIFGIGLTRAPQGFVKEIIQNINNSDATVVSIDFPSGLFANTSVLEKGSVIKATHTLTFQNPKQAFLLPENEQFCGDWHLLDIGLDTDFIDNLESDLNTITEKDIQNIYKPRTKFSHKGTYGHSLIIGGSFGKIGAVILASKAAVRIGSGLVTAYVPKCGYQILQTVIPEVMTEVDGEKELEYFNFKVKPSVIGIGMGIGTSSKTTEGLEKFLKKNTLPLVIDADALNIISENKSFLKFLPKDSILTPHPKEFERLVGKWKDDYDKLEKLKEFSKSNNCIVILKGAYSVIAFNDNLFFNTTGNPALATGGSGDVLTGVITGLIAQGYSQIEAALFGVYLHGRAADIAIEDYFTEETFSATDIIGYFTVAYKEII